MTFHVLVPDSVDQSAIDLLTTAEDITVEAVGKMARADLLNKIATTNAIIIRSGVKADAELLNAATELKFIARAGVGVDNVDLAVATERGIVVMNTPDGNTVATAEHTFAILLGLMRHVHTGHQSLVEGRWDRKSFEGNELRGKTLGIVGFGRIGKAVAKRALAFEMNVVTYDPYVMVEMAQEAGVEKVDLAGLFERSDILTLHTVITEATLNMIDAAAIARMKDGVRIVNAARGALIDEAALADALDSGKVAGAALDVYSVEPPENNRLISHPKVLHTPHLAASTEEAQTAVAVEAAEIIIRAARHGIYTNVVNPDVLE
ncbi:MAG: hydroxyacid dehydrogenase [Phototrophicaceae bacterium]